MFITFEGPDGSGKSTQARILYDYLWGSGYGVNLYDAVLVREPGGTCAGELIRDILRRDDTLLYPETEALLFMAARAQLVREVIKPALDRGAIVICDRYEDSTFAYQSGGRGIGMLRLIQANCMATDYLSPDLTFLLDIPVRDGLRRKSNGERWPMEKESIEFHERVRDSFLTSAMSSASNRWVVIDATKDISEIADIVYSESISRINKARLQEQSIEKGHG